MRRSSAVNTWLKARSISSGVPCTAAGSGIPQWAVIGCPGQCGHTSCAALSQTVKTKWRGGKSGCENSSHDLLRRLAVLRLAFSSSRIASGRMAPSAVRSEVCSTFAVHNRFRHDRTGGITSAEKYHVIGRHRASFSSGPVKETVFHGSPSIATVLPVIQKQRLEL